MILSLTKAIHWLETCIAKTVKDSLTNQTISTTASEQFDLVGNHLDLTVLVASDANSDKLGPKHPLLSLRLEIILTSDFAIVRNTKLLTCLQALG